VREKSARKFVNPGEGTEARGRKTGFAVTAIGRPAEPAASSKDLCGCATTGADAVTAACAAQQSRPAAVGRVTCVAQGAPFGQQPISGPQATAGWIMPSRHPQSIRTVTSRRTTRTSSGQAQTDYALRLKFRDPNHGVNRFPGIRSQFDRSGSLLMPPEHGQSVGAYPAAVQSARFRVTHRVGNGGFRKRI